MAKFGLFDKDSGSTPAQTYDGDKMISSGEYVEIVNGTGKQIRTVAAIRLAPGQSVKEIDGRS